MVTPADLDHYRTDIRAVWREDGVVCLECGRVCKFLLPHVRRAHELTPDDYRAKWGYNRTAAFVSPDFAARLRELALRRDIGRRATRELVARARALLPRPMERRRQARLDLRERKTRAHDEDVLALARAGLGPRQIARRLAVSTITTQRHLRALRERGLLPAPPGLSPRFTRILELARLGLWRSEIAQRLGLSGSNVASAMSKLRARGVDVPTPRRPRPHPRRKLGDAEFVELLRQGLGDAEIAERSGLRRATIVSKRCNLRKRGLLPRPARRREVS
jgi:DNA-binding NarL/FixJ family response regulator